MTARGAALSAARGMNPIGWLGLPLVAAVLATVLLATPIRIFGFPIPQPVFSLAPAFAWALIRPSILPPFTLLLLGLFLDIFTGGPPGLWPLCLLTAYAGGLIGRRLVMGQDFIIMWAWYAGSVTAAFAVGVGLMAMISGEAPNLITLGWMDYLPTLLLYPFAHRLIERYEDADVRFR